MGMTRYGYWRESIFWTKHIDLKMNRPAATILFGILTTILLLENKSDSQADNLTNSQSNTPALKMKQSLVPPRPQVRSGIKPTVIAGSRDFGGKFFGRPPDPTRTHHYYIAAENATWDYSPQGQDPICGIAPATPSLTPRPIHKLRYVRYTDNTFKTKVKEDAGLGILGPVLRGMVGEYLEITLLNRTRQPVSMHPHGVRYDKDSEGAYYLPNPGLGAAVGPGATFTYVWQLDESSGPTESEPSSKGWLYHSHVNGDDESNLGLIGLIIVTDPKRARLDGTPADVDREIATLFMIFDESGSANEAAEHADAPGTSGIGSWVHTQMRREEESMYAINGRTFCNLSGLEMNEGEHVRWYLFTLGSEEDFHTPHWHGETVLEDGKRRTDVVELLPATTKVADMIANNPGTWLFHCHVAEHMQGGMTAQFKIYPKQGLAKKASTQAFFGLAQVSGSSN